MIALVHWSLLAYAVSRHVSASCATSVFIHPGRTIGAPVFSHSLNDWNGHLFASVAGGEQFATLAKAAPWLIAFRAYEAGGLIAS